MRPHDIGAVGNSQVYFNSPSLLARELYFYPICLGHYYCDSRYIVDRQSFDSYLLIYVQKGSGYVEQGGRRTPLTEGSIVMIDCYRPHKYYTPEGWEIYWIHFDGVMAQKYFVAATQNGTVISPADHYAVTHSLRHLLHAFDNKQAASEALHSKRITDLLTEFILCNAQEGSYANSSAAVVEDAIRYISEHLNEEITLESLARRASLSPFYFSRIFKKETGFTPHQYIVMIRIDYARYLLRTSVMTVKEISYRCGFNNECGFCTSFKKSIGVSPNIYRSQE